MPLSQRKGKKEKKKGNTLKLVKQLGLQLFRLNPFMHYVKKWSDILVVSTPQYFKACLAIFQHYS